MAWYVLYTKPGNEDLVTHQLTGAGLNVLNPKISVRRYLKGIIAERVEPLFPNYIFAEFDIIRYYHLVKYTRGVKYILFRDNPVEMPPVVIHEVESRMDARGLIKIDTVNFEPETRVAIKHGPFKDFYGIFEGTMNKKDRVRVLLEVLNARIEIDICLLERA